MTAKDIIRNLIYKAMVEEIRDLYGRRYDISFDMNADDITIIKKNNIYKTDCDYGVTLYEVGTRETVKVIASGWCNEWGDTSAWIRKA